MKDNRKRWSQYGKFTIYNLNADIINQRRCSIQGYYEEEEKKFNLKQKRFFP